MRRDEDALGGECAGRVVAVGPEVEGLAVGDAVVAIGAGFFGSFATTSAALVAKMPEGASFEEAATVPIAFLTAHYALNHQARMGAGDRVLIHAAAGGVGMAAVQLARRAGAEIFATAGSPAKREYLRSLGIPHVMDSRSLAFAEEVMERTAGTGVDIVLNSLAGDFIPKSLSVLAPGGRFLEIGKSQIWSPERVAAVKKDVGYVIVDLAETLVVDPLSVRPMVLELLALLGRGVLQALPRRVFPMSDVVGAFRYMAQARQIGKVVVTQEVTPGAPEVRGDATYLITGGLGGLGLEVAGWLTRRGARHLVLQGRRPPSPAQEAALGELRASGAEVAVVQGDVSRPEDVTSALAAGGRPLRGVFHCAGVLDDGVLLQQRWDRFASVMGPKVAGSWNLHRLTAEQALDFFVLFSSASALLGSPGQGNHAAANAFLGALAHHRRSQGLPAQSIDWGVWTRVGAAAERNVGQRVAVQGMGSFSPEHGIRVLERLVDEGPVQVGVMPVQWPRFLRSIGATGRPFFAELVEARPAAKPAGEPVAREDLRQRLEEAPPNQRHKLVLAHVREQALKVLGLGSAHALDPRQPLNELGLDSLMAVELRNLLGTGTQRTLPATLVFDHPSIADLADYLGREVFGLEPAGRPEPVRPGGAGVLDSIEQLSEEEVDRLLDEKAAKAGDRSLAKDGA
jgi:polyketide synthase 12/myxalamid-type polyketide synthase MxaB